MVRIYKLRRHHLYLLPAQQDAFAYAHDNIMKMFWQKTGKKLPWNQNAARTVCWWGDNDYLSLWLPQHI